MANMEARSRALDATAAANAELDAEELRREALEAEDKNMSDDQEVDIKIRLPTVAEREEEKAKGGPDVQAVQERMRYCVRVLGNFKKCAEKGRWVFSRVYPRLLIMQARSRTEYIEQLILDIASYYGYNEFLAEKLFQLFPVAEVWVPIWHDL